VLLVPVYTFRVSLVKQLVLGDVRRSAWANRNLLEGCAALTAAEVERDFRISHGNILSTLRHIYDGERVWLHCLSTTADLGTWRLPPGPAPEYSLEALKESWPELWEGFGGWVEGQSENSLHVELNLQLPGGIEQRLPRWKILRHVLEHSTPHRGQVVGMIRMLGYLPPAVSPMDYYLAGEPGAGASIPRNIKSEGGTQAARLAIVEHHVRLENAHDLDGVLQTFGNTAQYDDEAWGEHYKGADGVRHFYEQLMKALPDLRIEVVRRHVAEDAILLEVMIRGTHLGEWRGLPATGRRVEVPLCGVYTFDSDDRLAGERIYYDRATVLRQLGVFHDPQSVLGQLCTLATHPVTVAQALARKVLRR
jgi:steroid delta-isomerase-like uncharacterized protein